jgi:hypothetical protein
MNMKIFAWVAGNPVLNNLTLAPAHRFTDIVCAEFSDEVKLRGKDFERCARLQNMRHMMKDMGRLY